MRLGLKAALLQRGLSQREFSRLSSIAESRVSSLVNGWVDPTTAEQEKSTQILKRSADELFNTNTSIEIRSAR